MDEHALSVVAQSAKVEAQILFNRTLTGWAMDLLALQQTGLDTPTYRPLTVDDSDYLLNKAA